MCTCVMHLTKSLGGVGWGDYVVVDTHNWRHEHVQRDSNLEIKEQQIRWGRADMDEQRDASKGAHWRRWRNVVCNLCDFHGLAVYMCVYGNGDDE